MNLTVAEKVRTIMKRKSMTMGDLADATGQTRQNLSNKMSRDNFTEKEIHAIAAALGCEASIEFRFPDGSVI